MDDITSPTSTVDIRTPGAKLRAKVRGKRKTKRKGGR